jgi:hypothetical protein
MDIRSFLAELSKTWLQRRVRRQAEVSDVLDVEEAKQLPAAKSPPRQHRSYKPKPPSSTDFASNM